MRDVPRVGVDLGLLGGSDAPPVVQYEQVISLLGKSAPLPQVQANVGQLQRGGYVLSVAKDLDSFFGLWHCCA